MHARLFAAVLAFNPAVNQTNIDDTICVAGWTKTEMVPIGWTGIGVC